jgi:hypothetical protein
VVLTATLAVLGLIAVLLLRGGDGEAAFVGDAPPLGASVLATLPDLTSPNVSWSPQGNAFALQREDGIYIAEAPAFAPRLVAGHRGEASTGSFSRVVWSRDGTRLAFSSPPVNTSASSLIGETIYVVNRDGSGLRDVLAAGKADGSIRHLNAWLNNETVAFDLRADEGYWVPMTVSIESGLIQEVVPPPSNAGESTWARVYWSPDGQWVALDAGSLVSDGNIVRIVNAASGETWDIAGYLDAGFPAPPEAWLADSSGVLVHVASDPDSVSLAKPEEQRVVTLVSAEPAAWRAGYVASWASPDGRLVAADGLAVGSCTSSDEARAAQCISFADTPRQEPISSLAFAPGEITVGSGPYGLLGWVGNDAVAFIGVYEKEPYRVLWLIKNPAEPEAFVWQEDTPGEGFMGMAASPDGRYAVVTMPTSENLFPATNFWEARVYEMP